MEEEVDCGSEVEIVKSRGKVLIFINKFEKLPRETLDG